MSPRSLLCSAILVGLGCAGPAATAPGVGTVSVTLLGPGRAPLTELRLQARPGDKSSTLFTFEIETPASSDEATPADSTTHAARIWFDTEVVDVTPGNDIRFESFVRKVSADSEGAQAFLKALEGLGWFVVESHRGVIKEQGIINQESLTPEQQALGGMNQSLVASAWTLPEEPVGIGARWQVEENLVLDGMDVRQRSTCTLTGIEGNMVSVSFAVSLKAPAQVFVPPGTPTERIRLISFENTGSGNLQLALDKVGFVNGSLAVKTSMKAEAADKEDTQPFSMLVSMRLGIESQ